jgi:hypothetical protein
MATASAPVIEGAREHAAVEPSVVGELCLLFGVAAAAAPLVVSRLGDPTVASLRFLAPFTESTRFRVVTGSAGLAVMLFQWLLSARSRTRLRLPGALDSWRSSHRFTGVALLYVVAVHTAGRWGVNLNGWLTLTLVAMMLVTQTGHVAKAFFAARAREGTGKVVAIDAAMNGEHGWVHQAGLQLHVVLACTGLVLALFHALAAIAF